MKKYLIIIGIVGIIAIIFFGSRFFADKNSGDLYKGDSDADTALIDNGLGIQTINEGAVTIAVTLIDQIDWSFEVIMDTHSVELGEDLAQISILMDENGNEHKPIKWEGDPPGGHHRKGLLVFGEIKPAPKSIVLIIRQVGGVAEKKFEWVL